MIFSFTILVREISYRHNFGAEKPKKFIIWALNHSLCSKCVSWNIDCISFHKPTCLPKVQTPNKSCVKRPSKNLNQKDIDY